MISACILAKNSEQTLSATLGSLKWLDEIILLDTGSTDQTIKIAKDFPNVVVHQTPFTSFGVLRNWAATLAKNDWILAIDSDEVLSPKLQEELQTLTLEKDQIYEFDFHNYYNNKLIRGCGWYPERHIRLYHRKMTEFSSSLVHEGILVKSLKIVQLCHPIKHTPYRSIYDFLAKMQLYSDLFVKENRGKKTSSFSKALFHALAAFFKSYILKNGFVLGKEGVVISLYNANVAFYKYLKLAETHKTDP